MLIDRLIAKYVFYVDKDDRRFFSPFGSFGQPVIVPEAEAQSIARSIAWVWLFQLLFLVLGVVGIACFTDLFTLSAFGEPQQVAILLAVSAAAWLVSCPMMSRATRGLEKDQTRTSFDLWLERQKKRHPHELGFATVLCAGGAVVCVVVIFVKSIWFGLPGALLCAFAAFLNGYAFMHTCPSNDK